MLRQYSRNRIGPVIITTWPSPFGSSTAKVVCASRRSVSGHVQPVTVSGTRSKRSALAPDIPTINESGLRDFELEQFYSIVAPAGTPLEIVSRLNREIVLVYNKPEVQEKILSIGAESVPSSPEQFGAVIKSEVARISKVIKDAGIRIE